MKKMKKGAKKHKEAHTTRSTRDGAKKLVKKAEKKVVKKARKVAKKGEAKVGKVMREYKHGELHSGSKEGPKVKNPKQAIAIALSEARKSGAKIPKKRK